MPTDLNSHQPRPSAVRRALVAGIDLLELKSSDPLRYMMFNAEEVVQVGSDLVEVTGEAFFGLFPEFQLFQLPAADPSRTSLMAFPQLESSDLGRLDDGLARLATELGGSTGIVVYRVVSDHRGERRELDRPVGPDLWQGQQVLVGPFSSETQARAWGEQHVAAARLNHDVVMYAGVWLCDVFELGES